MRLLIALSGILITANSFYVQAGIDYNFKDVAQAKKKLSEYFSKLTVCEPEYKITNYFGGSERNVKKIINASIINPREFQTGCHIAARQLYPESYFEKDWCNQLDVDERVRSLVKGLECLGHEFEDKKGIFWRKIPCDYNTTMRFIVKSSPSEEDGIYFDSSCVAQVMIRNHKGLCRVLLASLKIVTKGRLGAGAGEKIITLWNRF